MNEHMHEVYFIYGLAFFLLGAAIFVNYRKDSATTLGKSLWLLGGFGLCHGTGEWMGVHSQKVST